MPKTIASYLKLADPESYTGHSFRRSSATLLADSGADLVTLKQHGGWKSSTVAEGYVEDSFNQKKKVCQQITSSITTTPGESFPCASSDNNVINIEPSTSKTYNIQQKENEILNQQTKHVSLNFNNCSNVSIFLTSKEN